ncbi:MAG: PD40 domain-containing protein [Chloroflexi bacterium]|nr:PD40 domain-containing protein [Chloroflexota bacterium]
MWRLTCVGLAVSGLLFALVIAVLTVADHLPAIGQVAYITTPTRARGGQVYLLDIERQFRHRLFTLPTGVNTTVFAPDGRRLAFVASRFDELSRIYVTDISGHNPVNVSGDWGFNDYPAWSPDGRRLAFLSTRGQDVPRLMIANADGTGLRQLSDETISFQPPAWSPDGKRIAFVAGAILVADAQTGAVLLRLNPFQGSYSNLAWSPDGRALAFTAFVGKEPMAAYTVNADGSDLRRLTPPTLDVRRLSWSPDGRHLAVMAFENDNADIYRVDASCRLSPAGVAQQPGCMSPLRLTSNAGFDWLPVWSPDGRWLSYVAYQNRLSQLNLMAADGTQHLGLVGGSVGDFQPAWLSWGG